MSTPDFKLFDARKTPGELRWLSGFVVFGSLLTLPGLLPVTLNLDLDGDLRQVGARFFAFNLGFVLAASVSAPLLNRSGVRPFAVTGLSVAIASLVALPLLPLSVSSFWWELLPVVGTGVGAGAIAIGSLFALKPWSSHVGTLALPRLSEIACLGCVLSSLAAGTAYAFGWSRFTPLPIAVGASLCLVFCLRGRQPLAVVKKRNLPSHNRSRRLRSITSFLLLSLLLVQLGSEWSVAAWLPLFLIHRLGSGPVSAIFALSFYFLALLFARAAAGRIAPNFGMRTLAISGTVLALAGCLVLSASTSAPGIAVALFILATGFAPPYPIVKSVLDQNLHFEPAFYRAILSVAVTGAMCAAWLLGFVHQFLGIRALAIFPAIGSLAVLVLELLLMFESHLMSERTPAQPGVPSTNRRAF